MKKYSFKRSNIIFTAFLVIFIFTGFIIFQDDNIYLKINKGIELFGRIYKEVSVNYVDDIEPEKFMEMGINGMLSTLDPYTVYVDESKNDDLDLIQTGKYGGIGITVGMRDGNIVIIGLIEGYSAQKKGLLPGDKLIEIENNKIQGLKVDEVRKFVRGTPGTDVKIKIEREGEKYPLEFILQREEIQVKNVTYFNIISDNIGYIRLERFSRSAGEEVKNAIKDMKSKGDLKGIILDLRNNPGGLLDAAFEVTKKFVPRNSTIVSTRGRRPETERKFVSDEEPIAGNIPMIVLVNGGSASASEIVAGAIQDLDRGIILGNKTFGKGLVQSIVNLNYNTSLKITTAKYYTPSGRCIQKIDYMHKNKDGVFLTVPDSLKKHFKTINGRDVSEAGGITPDTIVVEDTTGEYITELIRKSLIFRFATTYANNDQKLDINEVSIKFKNFLKNKNFEFKDDSQRKIEELLSVSSKKKYSNEIVSNLKLLDKQLKIENNKEFDKNESEIKKYLDLELTGVQKGQTEQIKESLQFDKQLSGAVKILKNEKVFKKLLNLK